MDSFFGIGIAELFFIALIALVVLGPERLPGAIREVSKVFRYVRNLSNELTSQFSEEMKALDDLNPQKLIKEFTDGPDEKAKPAAKTAPKVGAMAAGAKPLATKKPTTPAKPVTRKIGTANDAPKPPAKPAVKSERADPATQDAEPAITPPKAEDAVDAASPDAMPASAATEAPADSPEPSILPPELRAEESQAAHEAEPAGDRDPDDGKMMVEASTPSPKTRLNGTSGTGSSAGGDA